MERSGLCKNCKKRDLVPDHATGNMVCGSCGIIQELDNFQHPLWGASGPTGSLIRTGTAGSGTEFNYRETKIYKATLDIGHITSLLGISDLRKDKVREMVRKITEGEYGEGKWLSICIGACTYIVMREDLKALSLSEVVNIVGCDVHELGRMVSRVVNFLDLKLPEFDLVGSFEKGFRACFDNGKISKDRVKRMMEQGIFLIHCLVKWWVTTGRRPLPVIVAVLLFIAKLNDVDIKIGDIATKLHAVVSTSKLRYKELLERLVEVAKKLPWGEDITVKNIIKNAPFVIQYMELKSMSRNNSVAKNLSPNLFVLDDLVGQCLSAGVDYGHYKDENAKDYQYFELENKAGSNKWDSGNLDELQISHECLLKLYLEFSDEVSDAIGESGGQNIRKRIRRDDLFPCWDWWNGKSEFSKKLIFKKILEKDIGLNMMPPSFVSGCLAYSRRREKIKAAKVRIAKIMSPLNSNLSEKDTPFLVKCKSVGKRRRRIEVDTDWEDFIIETLLLHQVKEEEIEKGHYNTLLELHVFN